MSRDISYDLICRVSNSMLWEDFRQRYYLLNGHYPTYEWTENEVRWWLEYQKSDEKPS